MLPLPETENVEGEFRKGEASGLVYLDPCERGNPGVLPLLGGVRQKDMKEREPSEERAPECAHRI